MNSALRIDSLLSFVMFYGSTISYLIFQVTPGSQLKTALWVSGVLSLSCLALWRFACTGSTSNLRLGLLYTIFFISYALSFIFRSGLSPLQYIRDIFPQYLLAFSFLLGYLHISSNRLKLGLIQRVSDLFLASSYSFFVIAYFFCKYASSMFLADHCLLKEDLSDTIFHCSNLINSDVSIFRGVRNSLIALPLCLLTLFSIEYQQYRSFFFKFKNLFTRQQVLVTVCINSVLLVLVTSGSKVGSIIGALLALFSLNLIIRSNFIHFWRRLGFLCVQIFFLCFLISSPWSSIFPYSSDYPKVSVLEVTYSEVKAEFDLYLGNSQSSNIDSDRLPTLYTKISRRPVQLYRNSSLSARQDLWFGTYARSSYRHEGLISDLLSLFQVRLSAALITTALIAFLVGLLFFARKNQFVLFIVAINFIYFTFNSPSTFPSICLLGLTGFAVISLFERDRSQPSYKVD